MTSSKDSSSLTRRRARARRVTAIVLAAALGGGCAARARDPLVPPSVIDARERATRSLQSDLAVLFSNPALRRGTVAVRVESLDRGGVLFRYNDESLMLPASNQKLLTLAAAAVLLGWEYRFVTTIHPTGPIRQGMLDGDLVVVGSGDPSLSDRYGGMDAIFASWAETLRAAGVTTITGRLMGDARAMAGAPWGAGWAWDNLQFGYAAPVAALQAGDNAAAVTVVAGPEPGAPASVTLSDPRSGLVVEGRVTTVAAGAPMVLRFERLPGTARLDVSGEMAVGDQVTRAVSVGDPVRHFLTALREVFAAHGIEIVRGIDIRLEPADMATLPVPLVHHESPPLRELAATAMRTSHNLHAESLFRALARLEMPAGTVEDARRSIIGLLERWGVPADAVIVADGSGLSRDNFVTASALMAVLRGMATDDRHRDEWLALFPAGGREGTLSRRFADGAAAGRVRAKTGTLSAVKALSGYVRSREGELLAFVMLVNNAAGTRQEVEAVLDRAVERLAAFER